MSIVPLLVNVAVPFTSKIPDELEKTKFPLLVNEVPGSIVIVFTSGSKIAPPEMLSNDCTEKLLEAL